MVKIAPEQVRFEIGDFDDARVVALLRSHLHVATSETAAGSGHALDHNALQAPDVTLWTAWEGDTLLGCGAPKRLSRDHGEVKSMHTLEAQRGRGVAKLVLDHIVRAAEADRLSRLSLQTSTWAFFEPAVALYRAQGFEECPPFGSYAIDQHSVFFTRRLSGQR